MRQLGSFERLILEVIVVLSSRGGEVYGVPVRDEIHRQTGKAIAFGPIYVSFDRLERKGLIASTYGGAAPVRGGRNKRFVRITAEGEDALREAREYSSVLDAIAAHG